MGNTVNTNMNKGRTILVNVFQIGVAQLHAARLFRENEARYGLVADVMRMNPF